MTETNEMSDSIEFDREAVRARYRETRDKRLRPDGPKQYLHLDGQYLHFLDDPWVTEVPEREPVFDEAEVVVIGGGFAGLLTGARLRELGEHDIRIIDKAGDFGGTWYWNRYPGAQCDVESYVYLPLLEEVGFMPKEKYSHAPEIIEHSRNIARHFDLEKGALLNTEVTEVRWDEDDLRWIVMTNRGDALRARFLVMCCGPLTRPKLPDFEGLTDFKGRCFHSSRWDYSYTGGSTEGDLTGLSDKKVAVIGTGATGVQIVPRVAEWAEHLYVFQRTPSSIDRRDNRPTDPEWVASLEPGWQKRRMENFTNVVSGVPEDEDLVDDGWTDIIGEISRTRVKALADGVPMENLLDILEIADYKKMEQLRARIDSIVEDPVTAEALKPQYRYQCKRPCFHDEYLQAFNRPNVTLVDTDGKGVERITERGVVANGVEYEVDCIVYATGFELQNALTERIGFEVYGSGGVTLTERCLPIKTLNGVHMAKFPNLFFIAYYGAAPTVNFPHSTNVSATHIAWLIHHAEQEGIAVYEATEEGVQGWIDYAESFPIPERDPECVPSYRNNEGQPLKSYYFLGGVLPFGKALDRWREAGTYEGLEITRR
jgi:cation diffusion facilitator CzcD-associated flavoprotein CzcO